MGESIFFNMKVITVKKLLLLILLSMQLFNSAYATTDGQPFSASNTAWFALDDGCTEELSRSQKNSKILTVNLSGIAIITVWGVAKWDYFTTSPTASSEGWFNNDTKSGGADKLGHAYTSYVTAHGLSSLYEYWCINKRDAAIYGALSSLAIVGYMEIGDSFSEFGFSKEDMVANIAGITFAYFSYINPELSNKLDFRWEYFPDSGSSDFSTDYENSKYLLALKFNGFEFARDSFLKHIELHAGYYTRGFADPNAAKERNLFLGIGINLTDFFRRHSYNKTSTVFKYYQLPGSSLQSKKDLNQ